MRAYHAQCDRAMAIITLVSPVPSTPTIKNDRIEVGKVINISATRMVA
ncbi:Uncharacterised protein [Mycobacterium tuberculosis]|nr:Uncharacterised protein [Mycobacterium tuberculosis]